MESILDVQAAIYAPRKPPPLLPHGVDPKAIKTRKRKRGEAKAESRPVQPQTPLAGAASFPDSDLPGGFPKELAFRALAAYATLRSFSTTLRLSPFTPQAFLRSIFMPIPNPLSGEIHVALLRILLGSLRMGYQWKKSLCLTTTKRRKIDNLRIPLRAGDDLQYLDTFTWPVFLDDYCHLTADILHQSMYSEENLAAESSTSCLFDDFNLPPDFSGDERIKTRATSGPATLYLETVDAKEEATQVAPKRESHGSDEEFVGEETDDDDDGSPFLQKRPRKRRKKDIAKFLNAKPPLSHWASGGAPTTGVQHGVHGYPQSRHPIQQYPSSQSLSIPPGGMLPRPMAPYAMPMPVTTYADNPAAPHSANQASTSPANQFLGPNQRRSSVPPHGYPMQQETKVNGTQLVPYPTISEPFGSNASQKPAPGSLDITSSVPTLTGVLAADPNGFRLAPPPPVPSESNGDLRDTVTANSSKGNDMTVTTGAPSTCSPHTQIADGDNSSKIEDLMGVLHDQVLPESVENSASHPSAARVDVVLTDMPTESANTGADMLVPSYKEAGINLKAKGRADLGDKATGEKRPTDTKEKSARTLSVPQPSSLGRSDKDAKVAHRPQSPKDILGQFVRGDYDGYTKMNPASSEENVDIVSIQEEENETVGWAHFECVRKLREGIDYQHLPLVDKLTILEFLIDELLCVDVIAEELRSREAKLVGSSTYGCLPSPQELQDIENEDECGVCHKAGDLLCCDGCPASYHSICVGVFRGSLPEGKWLCPECEIPDPSKFGSLRGGKKGRIEWFNEADLEEALSHSGLADYLLGDHSPSGISDTKYIVVQSYVLQRAKDSACLCCLDSNHLSFLGTYKYGSNWPFSQVRRHDSHNFTMPAIFNPCSYSNKYNKAPKRQPLQKAADSHSTDFGLLCSPPNYRNVTELLGNRFTGNDSLIKTSLESGRALFDSLQMVKDYMLSLEQTMLKAYLLEIDWGTKSKTGSATVWARNVGQCRSISVLSELLVKLADSIHPRAFVSSWFEPAKKLKGDDAIPTVTDKLAKFREPQDSTPVLESLRRHWLRCPFDSVSCLLRRENQSLSTWIEQLRPDLVSPTSHRSKRKKNATTTRSKISSTTGPVDSSADISKNADKDKDVVIGNPSSEIEKPLRSRRRSDHEGEQDEVSAAASISARKSKTIEKVVDYVSSPLVKEIPWPVAGRKLFAPVGSLSKTEVRRLGRNGGMLRAAFVTYSQVYEVGQLSNYHVWRKQTLESSNQERLMLSMRQLQAALDETVSRKCKSIAKNKARLWGYADVICCHNDIQSGVEFYLVTEVKGDGQLLTWLPSCKVDFGSFVKFRHERRAPLLEANKKRWLIHQKMVKEAASRKQPPSKPPKVPSKPKVPSTNKSANLSLHPTEATALIEELLSSYKKKTEMLLAKTASLAIANSRIESFRLEVRSKIFEAANGAGIPISDSSIAQQLLKIENVVLNDFLEKNSSHSNNFPTSNHRQAPVSLQQGYAGSSQQTPTRSATSFQIQVPVDALHRSDVRPSMTAHQPLHAHNLGLVSAAPNALPKHVPRHDRSLDFQGQRHQSNSTMNQGYQQLRSSISNFVQGSQLDPRSSHIAASSIHEITGTYVSRQPGGNHRSQFHNRQIGGVANQTLRLPMERRQRETDDYMQRQFMGTDAGYRMKGNLTQSQELGRFGQHQTDAHLMNNGRQREAFGGRQGDATVMHNQRQQPRGNTSNMMMGNQGNLYNTGFHQGSFQNQRQLQGSVHRGNRFGEYGQQETPLQRHNGRRPGVNNDPSFALGGMSTQPRMQGMQTMDQHQFSSPLMFDDLEPEPLHGNMYSNQGSSTRNAATNSYQGNGPNFRANNGRPFNPF